MPDQQTTTSPPPPDVPLVGRAVSLFVSEIKALKRTEEFVMPLLSMVAKRTDAALETFISKEGIESRKEDGKHIFTVPIPKVRRFERLQNQSQSYGIAFYQTPGALLVALVSRYDAYLGQLLRSLFYLKPELLNTSQRSLSFQQLVEFADLGKAREYVVEKEIEAVIRESHSKQFEWMESRFDVTLRKGLESWPCFIEITERRNLFVHTAGTVSSQYLDVCRKHGASTPDVKPGDSLWVDADYFQKAFECLFEMGVKLGHVLWRKLAPSQLEQADQDLNAVCFDLLNEKEYRLAKELLLFANNVLKKHSSNLMRRVFLVNLALAHRGIGEKDEAARLIKGEDWSDSTDKFDLALAVLRDDFAEAERLMRSFGKEAKGIGRAGYETWPLFEQFRETPEFQSAFRDIYGEDFELETGDSKRARKDRKATKAGDLDGQQGAAPNGGPATQPGNSGVTEGPPSVS